MMLSDKTITASVLQLMMLMVHGFTLDSLDDNPVLGPPLSPSAFLRSLCPAQFCINEEDRQEPEDTCCLPCHCTKACNVSETCCAEHDFISNNSQSTPSTHQEVCANPDLRLHFDTMYTQSYMMVSTCSPFFSDFNYVTKCENSDDLTMDSLTPIYHHETGLTYRNVFCAICNFANENYTQWVPKLSCMQMFETYYILTKPFNNFTDVIQNAKDEKACDVIWDPIDVPSKPCYRRQDLVSSCPAHASPTLMELCEDDEFIAPILNMGMAYKNLYCLSCSTGLSIQEICSKNDSKKDHNVEVFLNIDVFDGMLTENDIPLSKPEDMSNSTCRAGFEMDKDLMACGQMSCSVSMVNVNGVCQPLYDRVKGMGYQFSLSLQYQGIPREEDVLVKLHEFLPDTLRICEEDIRYQLTETMHVRYWATMVSDTIVSIHELYNEFEQRVNTHKEDEFTVEIGDVGYGPFPIEFTNYVFYDNPVPSADCPSTIAMAKIQFCDTVLIEFTDTLYDIDGLIINGFKFKLNEYILRTRYTNATRPIYVQICRDTLELLGISTRKVKDTQDDILIISTSTSVQMADPESSTALGFHAGIWNVAAMYIFVILLMNKD